MSEQFDQPYSEDSSSFQNETPQPDQVMVNAIQALLYDLHTAMPGQVTKVRGNSVIDVQPLLKRRYRDGSLVVLPIIQNIPVMHQRGAGYSIKLPIAVGDTGLIVFTERSIDAWSVSGGIVDPADPRKHDLSDAIFLPGLYPNNNQVAGGATDMVLTNGSNTITISKSGDMVLQNGSAIITLEAAGKFKIANAGQELLALLDTLVNTLVSATVVDPIGPTNLPFSPSVITALNTIKTNLETLKG